MVCGRSNSVLGSSSSNMLAGLAGILSVGGVQTGGSVDTGNSTVNNTVNASANVTVGQPGENASYLETYPSMSRSASQVRTRAI
jgi:hypothetical protein